jgi:hypothetical protein
MKVEDLVFKIGPFTLNVDLLLDEEYGSIMYNEQEFMFFW